MFTEAGSLAPQFSAVDEDFGDCPSESFVNGRSDAWRCFVGDHILDPCFETPEAEDVVACVESPWTKRALLVEAELDYNDRYLDARPGSWALELTNGKRCVFVSGASTVVAGRRLNYFCGKRGRGPYLFGSPDRSKPLWRIRMAKSSTGRGMRRVAVRIAWR